MSATPTVQVTEYTISVLPEDDINHGTYALAVQYRGDGRWAVYRMKQCLGRDNTWDYESVPSERADEWLDEHRFEREDAIDRARKAAPHVRCNGITAAQVASRRADCS